MLEFDSMQNPNHQTTGVSYGCSNDFGSRGKAHRLQCMKLMQFSCHMLIHGGFHSHGGYPSIIHFRGLSLINHLFEGTLMTMETPT